MTTSRFASDARDITASAGVRTGVEAQAETEAKRGPESMSQSLLVVFYPGQEAFLRAIDNVLGQDYAIVESRSELDIVSASVVAAVSIETFLQQWSCKDEKWTTIVANDVRAHREAWEEALLDCCHFEYVYDHTKLDLKDIVRFLTFVLGQRCPHAQLSAKHRTTMLSASFSNVSTILADLEILTIGVDAIELRVDCLNRTSQARDLSLAERRHFVRQQIMLLRRRTELPIVFTLCGMEYDHCPGRNVTTAYNFLRKALQWGCEYIDVELWLPHEIRQTLYCNKGPSTIISSFLDHTKSFKWSSSLAQEMFDKAIEFGDVVKMTFLADASQDDQLKTFRDKLSSRYDAHLFSGINVQSTSQAALLANRVLTGVTHPLLQSDGEVVRVSVADLNKALHFSGHIPSLEYYSISHTNPDLRMAFMEKCFNELSLPHRLVAAGQTADLQSLTNHTTFGGLIFDEPRSWSGQLITSVSEASRVTGQIDIVTVQRHDDRRVIHGDNTTWTGIQAMLTRHHAPSVYRNRSALVLANQETDTRSAIYALRALAINTVYTVGFECDNGLGVSTRQLKGIGELAEVEQPFVVINTLFDHKRNLVESLLKHYGKIEGSDRLNARKVFLDLTDDSSKGDRYLAATRSGWRAYTVEDVRAWTTREMMRLLVGQNVPYEFVRLASGAQSF